MGGARRRADAAQPDRLRGSREDDLHDQLHVVGDLAHGQRARERARRAGAGRPPDVPDGRRHDRRHDEFYTGVAKTGYRGAYLRSIAANVADGRLDLELLADPALPDDDVADRLLALPGVGPYATAHMMMLLGRYRRLILDSWTRPTYRRLAGRPRVTDKGIEKAFRRYREYAGLAFWLTLTRDWA